MSAMLAEAQAGNEQETVCLNTYISRWSDWDCEGIAIDSALADFLNTLDLLELLSPPCFL